MVHDFLAALSYGNAVIDLGAYLLAGFLIITTLNLVNKESDRLYDWPYVIAVLIWPPVLIAIICLLIHDLIAPIWRR